MVNAKKNDFESRLNRPDPMFVIKVKMPHPNFYPCRAKTQAEERGEVSKEERENYNAIFAAKPIGFEVKWLYKNSDLWPVDKEGYTWVTLFCNDEKKVLHRYIEDYFKLQEQLKRIREKLRSL